MRQHACELRLAMRCYEQSGRYEDISARQNPRFVRSLAGIVGNYTESKRKLRIRYFQREFAAEVADVLLNTRVANRRSVAAHFRRHLAPQRCFLIEAIKVGAILRGMIRLLGGHRDAG